MRTGLAVLVVGLFLFTTAPVAAQEDAYYDQLGVSYYGAASRVNSGNMTLGLDYEGEDRMPFMGCTIAKLRPEKDKGRLRMIGAMDGVLFEVDVSKFEAHRQDMQGGIATDLDVDGSRMHGAIQFPRVPASIAAWGPGRMYIQGVPWNDPATGNPEVQVSWFVTERGFRDDATGKVLDLNGSSYQPGEPAIRTDGDWEMHMRLESIENRSASAYTYSTEEPPRSTGNLDYFPPTESYREVYTLRNERFMGTGKLQFNAEALGQPGENEITVTIRKPDFEEITNVTLTPALNSPDTMEAEFPLDRLGNYVIEVTGKFNFGRYDFEYRQIPAQKFDVSLWWEDVHFGFGVGEIQHECQEALLGGGTLSGYLPPIPPAPQWPTSQVFMLVTGGIAAFLTSVKFVMMTRAANRHKAITRA